MARIPLVLLILLTSACNGSNRGDVVVPAADLQSYRLDEDGVASRDYLVYTPSSLPEGAPLLIYLHGCDQSAEDVAIGTRWPELADELGFAVVFPDQRDPNSESAPPAREDVAVDGNAGKCWNWFLPDEVVRGQGEVGAIAAITESVREELASDPDRVFVMGLSAGAIMTSAMLANYPELYAAGGIVAGCGYPYCSDSTGQPAYEAMGDLARRMPVIVFQGSADVVQPVATSREALQQWLGTNDYIDDGEANQTVSQLPAHQMHYGFDQAALPGEYNPCVSSGSYPCTVGTLFSSGDYPFSIELFIDARQCLLAEYWTIHGLGHNYPKGNTQGTYTDPFGPDINRAAWNFFISQSRGGPYDQPGRTCAPIF
ncbi:PHB depolymerase family esterase [Spongiibacter sp. KMU-166]|uniref:PHB depolymerase family esterase n=1 Tax=Spongiibacter thalassae TaxID=2721624 RepID=A0ABX1GI36_9GAMM|nr:PHB depolymerase family esterase [Spongiibacter thalassae]NKI18626.1 PHB depolymerase family esterase [Spongiibacter thalassae]